MLVDDLKFMITHPNAIPNSKKDKEILEKTISYLRKIDLTKVTAQAISTSPEIADTIEDSINAILKDIENTRKTIEANQNELPPVEGNVNLSQALREADLQEKNAKRDEQEKERKNRLEKAKKLLASYESVLNKLQKARENIENPVELANLFIDIGLDVTEQNKSEQDIEVAKQEIVDLCATAMAHGYMDMETVNGEELFSKSKDSNFHGYTANPQAIGKFLEIMSDEESLILSSDYAIANAKMEHAKEEIDRVNSQGEKVESIYNALTSPELNEVTSSLREILNALNIEQAKDLASSKQLVEVNKSPIAKFFNRIRDRFGKKDKTKEDKSQEPKQKSSNELIEELKNRAAEDKKFADALDAIGFYTKNDLGNATYPETIFIKAEKDTVESGKHFDFIWESSNIRNALDDTVKSMESSAWKFKNVASNIQRYTEQCQASYDVAVSELPEIEAKLTPKAKEMLETIPHGELARYREKYIDRTSKTRYDVSPFTALTVLKTLSDKEPEKILSELGEGPDMDEINQAYAKGEDFAKVINTYVKKSRDDIKIDNDEI